MFNYYFNIALIYLVIAFAVALFFFFILKKSFLGSFWGALLVAVIGAFVGGVIEYFFADAIQYLTSLAGSVNVFPPLISAFVLVWIFSKAGSK